VWFGRPSGISNILTENVYSAYASAKIFSIHLQQPATTILSSPPPQPRTVTCLSPPPQPAANLNLSSAPDQPAADTDSDTSGPGNVSFVLYE